MVAEVQCEAMLANNWVAVQHSRSVPVPVHMLGWPRTTAYGETGLSTETATSVATALISRSFLAFDLSLDAAYWRCFCSSNDEDAAGCAEA